MLTVLLPENDRSPALRDLLAPLLPPGSDIRDPDDGLEDLAAFGQALEDASLETLLDGVMTRDLIGLVDEGFQTTAVNSEEFLDAIAGRLAKKRA